MFCNSNSTTTTDNCSGTITGTTTDDLTYTTQGTHVITWTFDDGNGNISTATQNVVIDDVTAPVVPVLADVTGECSATAQRRQQQIIVQVLSPVQQQMRLLIPPRAPMLSHGALMMATVTLNCYTECSDR